MSLVLSLFPGIGLLDSAFEQEGFCVVRGPDVLWGGDIRRFHPPAGRFDGVIGGPPCQSFSSLAFLVRANGREVRFGNLIPEFERCVAESDPQWFLMENVRGAPCPSVSGYCVHSFMICNSWLPGENDDGFGQEQMRLRRFNFGTRGKAAQDLRRWIDIATFILPDGEYTPDNSKGAKVRHEAVTGGHDKPPSKRIGNARRSTVTSNVGGNRVYARRYKIADACRLQGLPEDFFSDSPFTAEAKLKAVANGVPLPMGRAIAKAVKEATQCV